MPLPPQATSRSVPVSLCALPSPTAKDRRAARRLLAAADGVGVWIPAWLAPTLPRNASRQPRPPLPLPRPAPALCCKGDESQPPGCAGFSMPRRVARPLQASSKQRHCPSRPSCLFSLSFRPSPLSPSHRHDRNIRERRRSRGLPNSGRPARSADTHQVMRADPRAWDATVCAARRRNGMHTTLKHMPLALTARSPSNGWLDCLYRPGRRRERARREGKR